MEKFTKLKFKDDDFEMDINVSTLDNSIWLNQKELALLFNTSTNKISYHINCITKSDLHYHELIRNFRKNFDEHEGKRGRPVSYYNLKIALTIGTRMRSNKALILQEYLRKHLLICSEENNERIIIYNNGRIDIPINIDLKTENAWASVKQIATLFDTSLDNVYLHIKNIFNEGELDVFNNDSVSEDSSVTDLILSKNVPFEKEIMTLADDGKYYLTKLYNLDVILAVGYRVKSLVAMRFRRWITFVLKKILTKGYYLDDERCQHCNKVLELENTVLKLKNEQLKEIRYFPGDELRGFIEIKRFLETAKDGIIIIDNYFGHEFDEVLLNINVKKTVITNPKNIKIESNNNYEVIKVNYYHDRYIIVDKLCYTFGQSPKDVGIHESSARRLANFNIEEIHQNIKKWKGDTYLDK